MLTGPQGERIPETDAELRSLDSSVAAGTDRSELEFATKQPLIGPQGEIIAPLDAVCPTCGQPFYETASQPGEELAPDAPVLDGSVTKLEA